MDRKTPHFVRHNTAVGVRITFVTTTSEGKRVEMTVWDLVNKYGADEVLKMKELYPEVEDDS